MQKVKPTQTHGIFTREVDPVAPPRHRPIEKLRLPVGKQLEYFNVIDNGTDSYAS